MKKEENILKEIEKEAPFLSKIKKENHFSTPNNYFKELPEVITIKTLKKSSLINIFDILSYRLFIPTATLILVLTAAYNLFSTSNSEELSLDQLSELILEEYYIEMEDYLIYEAYAELLNSEAIEDNSEEDEYINYLIENNIDINSIIEEL